LGFTRGKLSSLTVWHGTTQSCQKTRNRSSPPLIFCFDRNAIYQLAAVKIGARIAVAD